MFKLPYKKLNIWTIGIEIVNEIYEITEKFPKEEIFGLTSQIRRSAVSIPSNIAEGSQRTSNKEFANFILIAKGSLAELQTQLLIAKNLQYLNNDKFEQINGKAGNLNKMLYRFYLSLNSRNNN
ncbi:MAG: s23 ribosomal protein [Candidatus Peregrinibacteria bacterium GW2011_GWF2_33_10]|nr:MAG: s23 ribosomal protein [Candidatus Peregrinibacteria bacterium GW2011_GWF2_33_10]OGJ44422.1 MAG: hypothetical protein A2263_01925 [Candidatus Peregrinibacteria bacterium RIFOXYA2_FULL_33_21]OGJ46737.1 MAG: hypothetical protein A2272_03350 [Candidatus Peregrinibacteria bacterium RIFOXYA12_FULL_33_12]